MRFTILTLLFCLESSRLWAQAAQARDTATKTTTPGSVSKAAYTVDWRAKRSDQQTRLRSDREVRVAVVDMAPFCFSYKIQVNQVPVVEQSNLSVASILMGDILLPEPLGMKGAVAPDSVKAGDRVRDFRTQYLRDAMSKELSRFHAVIGDLRQVKRTLDSATIAYGEVTTTAKTLTEKRTAARKALTDFVLFACQKTERGASHADAATKWNGSVKTSLEEFAEDGASFTRLQAAMRSAWAWDSLAGGQLAKILGDPDEAYIEYLGSPLGKVIVLQYQLFKFGLQERLKEATDGSVATLTRDREATRSQSKLLVELAKEPARHEQPVYLRDNTDRLEVSIVATGRSLPGDVVPQSTTETYEAPVTRRSRIATSVGFGMSNIDGRSFSRVTFPSFAGDSVFVKDSVYSTYAARSVSGQVAFAPFIQTHVSFVDWDIASLYLSGGIGARSVGGSTGPEYLLGLTAALGERVFLTAGSHWGRVEELLLGKEADVKKRPVPSVVGDDSAIGTTWKPAFALVLSWKL